MREMLEEELKELGDIKKGEARSGRQKRQIVEFQISRHLKWERTIPYKFDGRHSKLETIQNVLTAILSMNSSP